MVFEYLDLEQWFFKFLQWKFGFIAKKINVLGFCYVVVATVANKLWSRITSGIKSLSHFVIDRDVLRRTLWGRDLV